MLSVGDQPAETSTTLPRSAVGRGKFAMGSSACPLERHLRVCLLMARVDQEEDICRESSIVKVV